LTRYLPPLLPTFFIATSLTAQHVARVHRWATLVVRQDVRLELDTSTVRSTDHQRRVWLRWTFPTGVPEYASVELEERYVDCARAQTRLLAGQDINIANGTASAPTPKLVSGPDTTWHRPTQGSLVAEAVAAVCRWPEAGA